MSEVVDLLLAVQTFDLEVIDLRARLQQTRAELDEAPELRSTRSALQGAEEELGRLASRQRLVEGEVADLTAKVDGLEKRLYGQAGLNPKTVAPLQTEIAHHRQSIAAREDTIVELMVAVEVQEAEVRRLRDSVVALEALHAGRRPGIQEAIAALETKEAALVARRTALAGRIPAPALQVYRTLALSGRGRPVVRMVGGTCHGCGATLPTAEAQRVRQTADLPRCPRCGHIVRVE